MAVIDFDAFAKTSTEHRFVGIAANRRVPAFFIVTTDLLTLYRSNTLEVNRVSFPMLTRLKQRLAQSCRTGEALVETLDEETIARIVPLDGRVPNCCAVFLESVNQHRSVAAATKRYRLTKREVEILPLLLRGLTNAEMATELFVAECTIGDHLKNLMRKTDAKTRSEVIGNIFSLIDDLSGAGGTR